MIGTKKKQKNGQNIPRNTNREADLKTWQKFFGTENVHLTKHGHGESRAAIVIDDDESFRPCRVEAELGDPEGQYFGVLGDHNDAHCLLYYCYQPMPHTGNTN